MAIRFAVSRDQRLLKQYYRIREQAFREELGLSDFDGSEDEWDQQSDLLLALMGDCCVGGMRISGSTPLQPRLLPMETDGVELRMLTHYLDPKRDAYCQWGRLALLPEVRDPLTLKGFHAAMVQCSQSRGYRYNLQIAGMNRVRLYKKFQVLLGYRCEILKDIQVPPAPGFAGLPHLLSIGWLHTEEGCRQVA